MIEEYKIESSIHTKPVTSLEECIKKGDIAEFIIAHELIEHDTEPPTDPSELEAFVPKLTATIQEHFKRDILYMLTREINIIKKTIEIMESSAPYPNDEPFSIYTLQYLGYLYFFYHDEKIWPVFPKELKDIWDSICGDQKLVAEIEFNQELITYAGALSNLYGVYFIEQLVLVWNQHHKNKIEEDKTLEILHKAWDFQDYFYIDYSLIISNSIFSDENIAELLDNSEDIPYYMPTKSVIAIYAKDGNYSENRAELKAIEDFLDTVIPKDTPRREDLVYDLVFSCMEEMTPNYVADTLMEYNFPMEDRAACGQFSRLYQKLFESTRIWRLKGYTPMDFAEMTNQNLIGFNLPSVVPSKNKKIRRNSPCPCGSGKKYKKCCGAG